MVTFWYPAILQAGMLPSPYFDAQLAQDFTFDGKYFGGRLGDLLPQLFCHSLSNAPLANNQARFPAVLCSPPQAWHRRSNTDQAEELASHGYIVVALDHRDTALSLFPDGTIVAAPDALPNSIDLIRERVLDAQLVIAELARLNETDPVLGGHLDLEHVGAFGVALGGATTAELCRVETRCRAGVSLDGIFVVPEVLQQGVGKAFMILRSDGPDPANPNDDRKKVYDRLVTNAFWVKLANSVILNFLEPALILDPDTFRGVVGRPPAGPLLSGVRSSQIVRGYLVSFFNKYLKNQDDDHLLDGPSPDYPEVKEFLKK